MHEALDWMKGPCQVMTATKRTNTPHTAELMQEDYWETEMRIAECGHEKGKQINREAREQKQRTVTEGHFFKRYMGRITKAA